MNVLRERMTSPEVMRRREVAVQKVQADLADRIARARIIRELDKVMITTLCGRRYDVVAEELRAIAAAVDAVPAALMEQVAC